MSLTNEIIPETPEQETQEDFLDAEEDLVEQRDQTSFDIAELGELVKVASEGALTSKTVSNYRRYNSLELQIHSVYKFFGLLTANY
jgi:hypothetical protein